MKVALFVPCYIDQFYPQVAKASLSVLEKLGCQVEIPLGQTCCGQPLANAGYAHKTGEIDQHFNQLFDTYDYIVGPSGSCILHLKEHHPNPKIRSSVYEICEFLVDILKVKKLDAQFPFTIGLHQSCHGQRGLHLASSSEINEPKFSKLEQLLNLVHGVQLTTPARVDECCGFGGTFCLTEEAVSVKMGKDRIKEHEANQVDFIIGADTSCLMHLEGILRRNNSPIRVKHIIEILDHE